MWFYYRGEALVNICIYGDKNRGYIGPRRPTSLARATLARSSGICARTQPSVSICAIRFLFYFDGIFFSYTYTYTLNLRSFHAFDTWVWKCPRSPVSRSNNHLLVLVQRTRGSVELALHVVFASLDVEVGQAHGCGVGRLSFLPLLWQFFLGRPRRCFCPEGTYWT
jgi:hypothetical protein